jgi:uncharacterized membrane protein YhaH (DUF805 family)
MKILLHSYKNMFNYSGRASRKEYWLFPVYNMIIGVIYTFLVIELVGFLEKKSNLISIVDTLISCHKYIVFTFVILILIANIALTVRRFHDINKSGWWGLVQIIPFLYEALEKMNIPIEGLYLNIIILIILIIFLCIIGFKKGTRGPNRFGEEPQKAELLYF